MNNSLLFYCLYLRNMFQREIEQKKENILYCKYEHKLHIPNSSMRNPWNKTLVSDIRVDLLLV